MNWLEKEISWGVKLGELKHLVGRIGELYAALITGGQMAPETNQPGYDVVSPSVGRISVKTTTQSGNAGHLTFNTNTLDKVDHIIVLFINTEEMQIDTLLDSPKEEAMTYLTSQGKNKHTLSLGKLRRPQKRTLKEQVIISEVTHKDYIIQEYESGTISVSHGSCLISPSKPALRSIASEMGLSLLNSNGNELNTRQLGSNIIRALS